MEERPSWIQSVTNQFHFSLGGKVIGPAWFFLLSMGFMIFLSAQDKTWRATGVLMLLSAFSPMVQETRRNHGAPLPKIGWWTLLQNLIVMVSGAILTVDGAMMG